MKLKKRITGLVLSGIIVAYFLPFFLLLAPKNYRDAFFADYVFNIVYRHLTQDCKTDQEKITACYNFVKEEISMPHIDTEDAWELDVFTRGWGWCNQQARVLMLLVEKGDFEANLIWLFGDYSVSQHTVCEIKIDGKYRMFDPSLKVLLLNKSGELATLSEIEKKEILPLDTVPHPGTTNAYYLSLYSAKHPYKIPRKNATSKKVDIWYHLHRKLYLEIYLKSYFLIDGSNERKKRRIREKLNVNLKTIDTQPKILFTQIREIESRLKIVNDEKEKARLLQEQKKLKETLMID